MKHFKSTIAQQLEAYIAYRKTLGFTDKNLRSTLRPFDLFVAQTGITIQQAKPMDYMDFKKSLKLEPRSINAIIIATRGFFNYLIRIQHLDTNPLKDFPLQREYAFVPFIFSPLQIEHMFAAIHQRIRQEHFLNDLTVYTAIFLLAECGMRLSEPGRLKNYHYRKDDGTLYIEKTKFKKDRLIALPLTVIQHLNNYMSVADAFKTKKESQWLLPALKGGQLNSKRIYRVFHQAVKDIHLKIKRRLIGNTVFAGPTPHSLRHSFAVNTLEGIRTRGDDPQSALPILSVYMGHRKYRYTAVYLKAIDARQRRQLFDFSIRAQHDI